MKKITILLLLLIALPTGYLFSAPGPPDFPFPPGERPPHLLARVMVGNWEGTGNFLITDSSGAKTVDVEVTLDISNQDGNKFIGTITALYVHPVTGDHLFIGGMPNLPVGGHIEEGTTASNRQVNMVTGIGDAFYNSAMYMAEIDGQFQSRGGASSPSLTCRWRGLSFFIEIEAPGYTGAPSVGEFTLVKQSPLVDK